MGNGLERKCQSPLCLAARSHAHLGCVGYAYAYAWLTPDEPTMNQTALPSSGSGCPEGAALAPGDAIAWTSNANQQGSVGNPYGRDNGCAAKGTCGLPYSDVGPGGGWELCFA